MEPTRTRSRHSSFKTNKRSRFVIIVLGGKGCCCSTKVFLYEAKQRRQTVKSYVTRNFLPALSMNIVPHFLFKVDEVYWEIVCCNARLRHIRKNSTQRTLGSNISRPTKWKRHYFRMRGYLQERRFRLMKALVQHVIFPRYLLAVRRRDPGA